MRDPAPDGIRLAMDTHPTLHILGGTSRSRAEQASIAFALGYHAEVHADLADLLARPVAGGVILAGGELLEEGVGRLIDQLGAAGVWLPVIAVAEAPSVPDVVRAVEEGALDFLTLPLAHGELARMLAKLARAADSHVAGRRAMVEAQRRVTTLSRRERQVLDWLAEGCSNKHIARALDISPRTVEIHRANMMVKLGVQHSAEAVRVQCVARLPSTARAPSIALAPLVTSEGAPLMAGEPAVPLFPLAHAPVPVAVMVATSLRNAA